MERFNIEASPINGGMDFDVRFIVGAIPCRNGNPFVSFADISPSRGITRIARKNLSSLSNLSGGWYSPLP